MCGIAGAFGGLTGVDRDAISKQIIREVRYRGPDGDGIEHFDNGFFVHLRLSIIDTGPGGAQPKWSADRRFCITYNGEIYNYRELRDELMALGYIFTTESDTEVLLKVWEAWGAEGLMRCIGMYAFSLFDTVARQVHFARDTYGIKPIYIAETNGGVRFGSTYPVLACFPDCPRRVDASRAFEFVRYGLIDFHCRTLVAGVRALEPGAVETWDVSARNARFIGKQIIVKPRYEVRTPPPTFEQAADELREAFLRSVRLHMRSDVPIGFALSGGIDSSAIVCAARMLEPDADLRTFTYAAQGNAVDESGWAKLVSDRTRSQASVVRLQSASAVSSLSDVVRTHGSPTGGMSTQAQMAVFNAAYEAGVKVMLDGQGADESFAGYTSSYFGSALAGYVRRGEYARATAMFRAAMKVPRMKAWALGGLALDHLLAPRWKHLLRHAVGLEHMPDWVDQAWVESRSGQLVRDLGPSLEKFGPDVLAERLALDLTELLPDLLLYEDRNSMRHSVESRVPFLSSPVTDVAFSVPSSYHIDTDAQTKKLLRAAMRGILPEEIRTRSDKIGFEVPQGDWLAAEHDRIDQLLQSDAARSIKLFNYETLLARWRGIDSPKHHDFKFVWRWIGLILWTEAFGIAWD